MPQPPNPVSNGSVGSLPSGAKPVNTLGSLAALLKSRTQGGNQPGSSSTSAPTIPSTPLHLTAPPLPPPLGIIPPPPMPHSSLPPRESEKKAVSAPSSGSSLPLTLITPSYSTSSNCSNQSSNSKVCNASVTTPVTTPTIQGKDDKDGTKKRRKRGKVDSYDAVQKLIAAKRAQAAINGGSATPITPGSGINVGVSGTASDGCSSLDPIDDQTPQTPGDN